MTEAIIGRNISLLSQEVALETGFTQFTMVESRRALICSLKNKIPL